MSRQSFAASDVSDAPPASFAAVASTTSATNLWVPSLWTPIGAFDMKPGKAYRLQAGGIISTTGTPTVIFTPRFGQSATPASNVSLGASATVTTGSGLASVSWWAELVMVVRSIGLAASGSTVTASGLVVIGGGASAAGQSIPIGGSVPTTADHTTAQGLVIDLTWGTNSASNTATCQWALIQSLN